MITYSLIQDPTRFMEDPEDHYATVEVKFSLELRDESKFETHKIPVNYQEFDNYTYVRVCQVSEHVQKLPFYEDDVKFGIEQWIKENVSEESVIINLFS